MKNRRAKMNGHWIFTWANGRIYEGEFRDYKRHPSQFVCSWILVYLGEYLNFNKIIFFNICGWCLLI